jgi:hypothetical protein
MSVNVASSSYQVKQVAATYVDKKRDQAQGFAEADKVIE